MKRTRAGGNNDLVIPVILSHQRALQDYEAVIKSSIAQTED